MLQSTRATTTSTQAIVTSQSRPVSSLCASLQQRKQPFSSSARQKRCLRDFCRHYAHQQIAASAATTTPTAVAPKLTRRSVLQLAILPCLAQAGACNASDTRIEQVAEVVRTDFTEQQYYVTGRLTPDIYAPDCVFVDPTVTVKGVKPYTTAVATLFDAATSRADLITLKVADDRTIVLRWRLEGALKIGGLKIKPYTGTTTYTLNPDGLIASHIETWDISTVDAFVSTFFPGLPFGAPPAPPV